MFPFTLEHFAWKQQLLQGQRQKILFWHILASTSNAPDMSLLQETDSEYDCIVYASLERILIQETDNSFKNRQWENTKLW